MNIRLLQFVEGAKPWINVLYFNGKSNFQVEELFFLFSCTVPTLEAKRLKGNSDTLSQNSSGHLPWYKQSGSINFQHFVQAVNEKAFVTHLKSTT